MPMLLEKLPDAQIILSNYIVTKYKSHTTQVIYHWVHAIRFFSQYKAAYGLLSESNTV